MNMHDVCSLAAVLVLLPTAACAAEESSLWGFNVSGGANFGFGLKSNLQVSPANARHYLPQLSPPVGQSSGNSSAASKPVPGGSRVVYDAARGYFIDPASSWGETPGNESETWNWRLPDSAVVGSGAGRRFEMVGGEWSEVVSRSETSRNVVGDDSATAYGASVDISHVLWASESADWGVDIAVGLTWMKAADCFKTSGNAVRRSATVAAGDTVTSIPGEFFASQYAQAESDNTWGNGRYDGADPERDQYLIDLDSISTVSRTLASQTYSDSMWLSARGDYEEWEISILLKPWYDLTDWMCVHGAFGLGVTRSSFDYAMSAMSAGTTIYQSSQQFDEWRCYGIAGGGLVWRIWDFDVSCDGLFRWCQEDMEIEGRDVSGTIEKPSCVLRLGLSYAF